MASAIGSSSSWAAAVDDAVARARIVRGNPDAIARVQALLDRYEQLWRSRIERLDALLAAEPHSPGSPGH